MFTARFVLNQEAVGTAHLDDVFGPVLPLTSQKSVTMVLVPSLVKMGHIQ